jgi:hypothetical protein
MVDDPTEVSMTGNDPIEVSPGVSLTIKDNNVVPSELL